MVRDSLAKAGGSDATEVVPTIEDLRFERNQPMGMGLLEEAGETNDTIQYQEAPILRRKQSTGIQTDGG